MKRVSLFLSPHFDDAVFSCAAQIIAEITRGRRVVVATLFTAGRGRVQGLRRSEDRNAMEMLGAEPLWLDLPDAPFRDRFHRSFRTIIFGTAESDHRYVDHVASVLACLCAELRPATVYVPLAVGTHIDHRLTFTAAAAVTKKWTRRYYEDRPYALVRHAVPLRLASLSVKNAMVNQRAFFASFRAAPYVRNHLPVGPDRDWCFATLRRLIARSKPADHASWTAALHRTDRNGLLQIRRALLAYGSQTEAFLGNSTQFFRAIRRYDRRIGGAGRYVERSWSGPLPRSARSLDP